MLSTSKFALMQAINTFNGDNLYKIIVKLGVKKLIF